jgi:putative transcriptional regulator
MKTIIKRHPDDATLLGYAAGGLNEALSAAVAAHVAMCQRCRDEVADMETLGEALLAAPALSRGAGCVTAPEMASVQAAGNVTPSQVSDLLPRPIALRYGLTFDAIPWRRLGPGVWHYRLPLRAESGDLRLLRIARGVRMPEHGHGGTELTLVLDGAYSDASGVYRRGDLQDIDEDVDHQPIADPEHGCVCLIASEQRARFKGLIGRILSPLTGL